LHAQTNGVDKNRVGVGGFLVSLQKTHVEGVVKGGRQTSMRGSQKQERLSQDEHGWRDEKNAL